MKDKQTNFERFFPIVFIVTLVLALAVGFLTSEVIRLRGGLFGGKDKVNLPVAPPGSGDNTGAIKLSADEASKLLPVSDSDHIRGNKDAEVFLIEYSDLQCPFCASFHPTVKKALEEYKDKFAWVYRHYPLDVIHPEAQPAAEASECVAEIGGIEAFWKFVDKIFENQKENLGKDAYERLAGELGIKKDKFNECLKDPEIKKLVDEDFESGDKAGVTGTPGSFIVNKKGEVWMVPGAVPYESLKKILDEALTK